MQITVADIQKIDVKDGQTLVVFVDISNRTKTVADEMLKHAAQFMRKAIPNTSVQIIAVPQHLYSFGVIDPTGQAQVVQQSMGGKPANAGDAFDRAMKGLG